MEGQTPIQQTYKILITAKGAVVTFSFHRATDASIKMHSLMQVFGEFDYTYDVMSRTYLVRW